ncbi:LysR family transcriptional regulator [Thiococcus pfennigii]|jgi:DNA-binding transcriptional LysR family regulator|uniref:LysR family transcriptional regulator n=1 Tax=Thiococcus pfennigii TaxID=1057 RepID=UPI00190316C8|nr:LysR family transcriptional regulator [Thiococcus pfennigii]MBK1702856.1 LysR family transcriptional regulator [Thiococcus pfennigii]MBK1731913.1 LysR family transcriptional regulator [Thiococcus pfennigii]
MRDSNLNLARHVSLRQLQVFEAIARLKSFTKAADELYLTQPTASTQIKRLSDAIGLPLFEQVGRQVYLTEAGRDLEECVRQMFDVLDRFEMKVADIKGLKQGYLRLCVITTAKYFAPEVLGRFCRKHTGVDVSLKVTNRDRVIERLAANKDDLYILGQNYEGQVDLVSKAFAPNPLYVVAHREHPLCGERMIPLSRLSDEPFIMREPGSGIRDVVLRTLEGAGLKPHVRMELGSNEAIKHAIYGQLGISVLSLHTLTHEGPESQLAILDVEGFPVLRQWYVAYPKGKELSVVALAFVEFLESESERLREGIEATYARLSGRREAPSGD